MKKAALLLLINFYFTYQVASQNEFTAGKTQNVIQVYKDANIGSIISGKTYD